MNQEEIKRRQQEIKEAWQWVMGAPMGRTVIAEVLRMSGLFHSPFHGATNQTIKNVGMQDVGRQVEAAARQHAFDDYLKLMKEEFGNG